MPLRRCRREGRLNGRARAVPGGVPAYETLVGGRPNQAEYPVLANSSGTAKLDDGASNPESKSAYSGMNSWFLYPRWLFVEVLLPLFGSGALFAVLGLAWWVVKPKGEFSWAWHEALDSMAW